jgi:hypothetical protein
MKLALTLLVVANLLLFGWFRGWMAPFGGDGREPGRLERQVQPQQLRILPGASTTDGGAPAALALPSAGGGPTAAATGAATAPGAVLAPAPSAAAAPAAPAAAAPPPAAAPAPEPMPPAALAAALRATGCARIGPLSEGEAVRLQVALDAVSADLAISTERAEDITSWWVYLPPSSVDTARRIADLREAGVTDTFVMREDPWKGAISLGLFRQEALAVALQKAIAARGVKGVRVVPRGPSAGRMTLTVRPTGEPVIAELLKQRGRLPDATVRPCPAKG